MFNIKIESLFNHLPNMYKNMKVEADKVNHRTADRCALMAQVMCPKDTGALSESIHAEKDEEIGWSVVVGTTEINYGFFVEYGTVKMAAQPFITPASEQFKSPFLIDMSGVPERAAS